jgi:hypothetical protein
MSKVNDLSGLEKARAIDGATHQDSAGRWYTLDPKGYRYGYYTQLGGLYVCYTCGHLCECETVDE